MELGPVPSHGILHSTFTYFPSNLLTLIAMSAPQDDERFSKKQRLIQNFRSFFSSKSRASSKSRNLDAPDERPTNTNVPSTSAPTLSASPPAHSTSRVHLVPENIVNPVSSPIGIGELISYASCICIDQPTCSQVMDPTWAHPCLQSLHLSLIIPRIQ